MKINHRLEKFVRMAIETKNFKARTKHEAEVDKLRTKALAKIEPLVKRRIQLHENARKAEVALDKIEKEITRRGYAFEGYSQSKKVVAHDLKKLGFNPPKLVLISEREILAKLLSASETEAALILAEIGIVE
jgi:predicted HTH domain antitoxin